jgi:hypothetical protein
MNNHLDSSFEDVVKRQGANALLGATLSFLRTNNISKRSILRSVRQNYNSQIPKEGIREYRSVTRAYEEMGIVISTWFSMPKFLDRECRPLPLVAGSGPRSICSLVRASRVSVSAANAIDLMRRSTSVRVDTKGRFHALRREFVLPNFAVPRAALVIERYLDTLHRNSSSGKRKTILLLERNCHVPEVDLTTIAPILRDIKKRGSAYIDSVNGDIEGLRLKRSRRKGTGEMSVHLFAWTRPSRTRKQNRAIKLRIG